ncbi:MAG: NUDIX domain-containing protein [Chlamydiia bacterium]|nr:NUDIX domain-containing protein [Chlamydiia bacterium]
MKKREESVNGIIFSKDRKEILLIKRRDVPVWVLPGGGIDPGESPEEAATREMKEETGFEVKLVRKIAEYTPLCQLARFTYLYEFEITTGSPTLTSETQGIAFFPLNSLPPLPPPYPDWIADATLNSYKTLEKQITSVTYLALLRHLMRHPILVCRFLLARLGLHIND